MNGRLTTLTYPGSKQVTYSYDPAGRLSTVTDWANRVTTYSYDAAGRVTQTLRPNGTKQTRTYDDAGQLTQLTEFGSDGVTVIYSGAHGYDAAGQLTGETIVPGVSSVPANATQTFDADNRLLTHNGAATNFDADGNLLAIAAGVAPASYTYDARNRLTGAGGLSYTYNAENRRVALTDGSGTTRYVVNPNAALDQVLMRTAADGTKTYYVYGLGLLHEETGATVRFYHHDRRGDTIALSDGTGVVTDRASYGVYGESLSRTGTTNTPFLFNGKWGVQTDAGGIYYHRARYYHPLLRRFLNQDTVLGDLTTPTDLNRFAYVANDPINGIDPTGLVLQFANGTDTFNYAMAKGYMSADSQNAANFAKLEASPTVYTLQNINDGNDRFNPNNNTIYWDPNSALRTTEGGVQTPALGLGHEVDHAVNSNSFLKGMTDPDYGNWEEKRVIQGSETCGAKKLGEDTRTNHGGTPFVVGGPLSTTPLPLNQVLKLLLGP